MTHLAPRKKPSLVTLPQELITEICYNALDGSHGERISFPGDARAVVNLSKTCKVLEEACSPTLFHTVYLVSTRAALAFLKAVLRRQYVCNLVRVVEVFETWSPAVQDEASSASAIVRTDPVAAKLLVSGKINLPILVIIRALQRLPCLHQLSAPESIFQVHHWPSKDRLVGPLITRLTVTSGKFTGHEDCDGLFSSVSCLQSFKYDQRPGALKHLTLSHLCTEETHEVGDEWPNIVSPLQHLSLTPFSVEGYAKLLQPCVNLTELVILQAKGMFEPVIKSVSACGVLAKKLQILHLSPCYSVQFPWYDANMLLGCFSHFTELRHLHLPMPAKIAIVPPATSLPPTLERLSLEWLADKENPFWQNPMPAFLTEAIKAGQMPKTLTEIIFRWWHPDGRTMHRLSQTYLVQAIPLFRRTCMSRGISLRHSYNDEALGYVSTVKLLADIRAVTDFYD